MVKRFTILLCLVLTIICAYTAKDIGFTEDLRLTISGTSSDYTRFLRFFESFPYDENDFIILVKSQDILTLENLRRLREIDFELKVLDGVVEVHSLFDTRLPNAGEGYRPPLFPESDATENEFLEAREQALKHPFLLGQLVSQDLSSAIFVVSAAPSSTREDAIQELYQSIQNVLSSLALDDHIESYVGGLPAYRIESLQYSKRDQLRFTFIGGAIGTLICWFFIRSFRPFLTVVIPPLIGVLWILGLMALFGVEFNVLTTILPILVIVIGFTDSMHLLHEVMSNLRKKQSVKHATDNAIVDVGPACMLTSLTTALAFGSLYFTESALIQQFGLTCAAGVLVNLLAVLSFVPAFCNLLLSDVTAQTAETTSSKPIFLAKLHKWIIFDHGNRSLRIGLTGILLMIIGSLIITELEPDHRADENLPAEAMSQKFRKVSAEKFGGLMPVRIFIESEMTKDLSLKKVSEISQAIERSLNNIPLVKRSVSLASLSTESYGELPESLIARFIDNKRHKAVVTAFIEELPTVSQIQLFDQIEASMQSIEHAYPEIKVSLTGINVLRTRQSHQMISELATSLGAAALLIFTVMTLAFRSFTLGLISILANFFPIVITASLLVLFGIPLQYSSVIVFTVALGIAVDDTIHFLSRFTRELKAHKALDQAILTTLHHVGGIIFVTTTILVAGMSSILLSDVPTLRLFGALCCISLTLALVADTIFLPSLLRLVSKKNFTRSY